MSHLQRQTRCSLASTLSQKNFMKASSLHNLRFTFGPRGRRKPFVGNVPDDGGGIANATSEYAVPLSKASHDVVQPLGFTASPSGGRERRTRERID
jgi:hypothetical protein